MKAVEIGPGPVPDGREDDLRRRVAGCAGYTIGPGELKEGIHESEAGREGRGNGSH
jgi:hypothetical protein